MRKSLVLLLALAFSGGNGWGASPKIETPSRASVLATLRPGHPRLLLTGADFERLRSEVRTDPLLARWGANLLRSADRLLGAPASRYEIPDGLRLLSTSRRVLDRVATLGLAHALTGEARFVERAWVELEAAARFPDWNPKHFLDVAEMTHAFALGYDWLHACWGEERRATLRAAIVGHGLTPALAGYRGEKRGGWWARVEHNWNQVCNGGIGIGALAVADECPEIAAEILAAGLRSIQLPMAQFAPDGAWGEGPGYWGYATRYNVALLRALETALGSDFGLSTIEGFADAGMFPIHMCGPTGRSFSYADSHEGAIRAPQLFWFATRFRRPEYAAFQIANAEPDPFDLVYYRPGAESGAAAAGLDRHFRGAEVASLRGAWGDRDATWIAFKAGDNRVNHGNLDLGTFVLESAGERWAVDLGADNYNLPGYFGKRRWEYYRMRAEGHNTLVIDPGQEPDQDPRAAARIMAFGSGSRRSFGVMDLTPAYAGRALEVRRGIALLDRRTALVQDEIAGVKGGAALFWFCHTPAEADLSEDGRVATLRLRGKTLSAHLLAPANARWSVMPAEPLPTSPRPEGQATNRGVRKLAIRLGGEGQTRVAVWFVPGTEAKGAAAPELVPLSRWGSEPVSQ